MAEAAKRSAANTDLYIGTLRASIGLFPTKAAPGEEQKFDTAGPNGGVLRYEKRAAEKPVGEETEVAATPVAPVDALGGGGSGGGSGGSVGGLFVGGNGAAVEGEFRQVLVEEGSDEEVKPDEVRRGVRMPDGRFIDCSDQIAAIEARTKLDRMDIVACIDSTLVRRERVLGSYYIGAQDTDAPPALRALYEALRRRRECAVVKYTTRSRQNLGVIVPHAKTSTLVLLTLVFVEDFREPPAKALSLGKAKITEQHVEMMSTLLGSLHDTADVFEDLRDDAIRLREELRARAEAGEMDAEVVEPLPESVEAQSLEAQLEASMAAMSAGKL